MTDENSKVTVLQPQHPVFTTPNRITDADWQGWRAGARPLLLRRRPTRSYTDLVEFVEPFPYNQGPKRGALVEAKVGSGTLDSTWASACGASFPPAPTAPTG